MHVLVVTIHCNTVDFFPNICFIIQSAAFMITVTKQEDYFVIIVYSIGL